MIKDSVLKVRQRILRVCSRVNRGPDELTVVAVSKGRSVQQVLEVIAAGITDIGENKVQEAPLKYNELQATSEELRWHMVGHLQTNKARDAVRIFDLIHSVDSLRLAQEIDKQATKINKVQDILIEVNTSQEASKFGLRPEETIKVIEDIAKLKNISIRGLMTIAPVVSEPEKARPYFRALRQLRDRIYELRATSYELRALSMGMTDDFEIAIEEGATMVRIGRAIFEE